MKKLLSSMLCLAIYVMFVMPVSANETPIIDTEMLAFSEKSAVTTRATNYFTGSTVKMNSLYSGQKW